MSVSGTVLRFERSSNKDGFGLRTVVFFKGCPLKCEWCSTPESQSMLFETGFLRSRCVLCHKCEAACPEKIISEGGMGMTASPFGCTGCKSCIRACPNNAVKLYGMWMTAEEVMDEIEKDSVFFHHGGGVTLSGGEVLSQPEFALEILRNCRAFGIDATVETSCFAPWASLSPMLDYLAMIFIDVKIMDAKRHKEHTGVDNTAILKNIKKIDETGRTKLILRTPFIPGVNDDARNYEEMADFCSGLKNLSAVEILPYHRLGSETYKNLGRSVPFPDVMPPDRETIREAISPLLGIKNAPVRIG